MQIQFPGGLRVQAVHEGFVIRTDQPERAGGTGTAPSPFDLFLASIGTCAGFYVLRFFQQRGLDTEGLGLRVTPEWDPERKLTSRIRIEIELPGTFPAKYREAVLRAVDQCSVKRHLLDPPAFDVVTVAAPEAVPAGADRELPVF